MSEQQNTKKSSTSPARSENENDEDAFTPLPRPMKEDETMSPEETGPGLEEGDYEQEGEGAEEEEEKQEKTSTTTTTAASSSSSSSESDNNKKLQVYSSDEMLEIRDMIKASSPLLSENFVNFMRGIAVGIEGTPTVTPTTGGGGGGSGTSATTTTGGSGTAGKNDFFGGGGGNKNPPSTGSGTPFTPHSGGGTGPQFPKSGSSSGGQPGGQGGGNEADLRNAIFGDVKVSQHTIKERTLMHQVRGIFGKVSSENYNAMKQELCDLPIRQSKGEEVKEIVHWIHDKAVQPEDEPYVELYANLIRDLQLDINAKDKNKGQHMRWALVEKCQLSFDNRVAVANAVRTGKGGLENNAETTVEKRDSAASAALKSAIASDEDPEYIRNREKTRLRANIKFLAQLYRVQMVTSKVVNYVLYTLLYGSDQTRRHKPEEYEIEMFCDLVKNVQGLLPSDVRKQYLPTYLTTIKEHSEAPKTSMRVKFLLQDLIELSENNWLSREERKKRGILAAGAGGGGNNNTPLVVPTGGNPNHVGGGNASPNSNVHHGTFPATTAQGGGGAYRPPGGHNNNNNNNNHESTPTPPYSPVNNVSPPYPNTSASNNNNATTTGGRGSGTATTGKTPGMTAQQQQHIQSRANQFQQAPISSLATKEQALSAIEAYKSGEDASAIRGHFKSLPIETRLEHLVHFASKSATVVRRTEERKLICPIVQILMEHTLAPATLGVVLMNKLAPQISSEYEDVPKIYQCWAEIFQPSWQHTLPLAAHAALLRELIFGCEAPFKEIDKMLTDVLHHPASTSASSSSGKGGGGGNASGEKTSASYSYPTPADAATQRFRMLPLILKCQRDSGDEEDDFDGLMDASQSRSAVSGDGSAGDITAASGGASGGGGEEKAAAAAVKQDLLGYLMINETTTRVDTTNPYEIELDVFNTLTNRETAKQQNIADALKRARSQSQKSDANFAAGFFCAIFCYLRIAAATGERGDVDKFREMLQQLRVPGENTQLFLRECYMSHCEFGGSPSKSFLGVVQMLVQSNKDFATEWKNFTEWRNKNQSMIQALLGWNTLTTNKQSHPNPLPSIELPGAAGGATSAAGR